MSESILVVNPNTNPLTTEMLVGAAEATLLGSGFTVHGQTAQRGPRMIITEDALAAAAQSTVEAALDGVRRCDPRAIIVGAFGDPGVAELSSRVDVPVIGIGSAAISYAAQRGRRFAIATTTRGLDASLLGLAASAAPRRVRRGLLHRIGAAGAGRSSAADGGRVGGGR